MWQHVKVNQTKKKYVKRVEILKFINHMLFHIFYVAGNKLLCYKDNMKIFKVIQR